MLSAALAAACLGALSAARLNSAYLLPNAGVKIDRSALSGPLFCALTFDDGPDATYTPRIAAVLQSEGVCASFFVVGRNVAAHPAQVRSLAAAGHEICNHSYSHADLTKLSEARQRREISACAEVLAELGITTKWFRPPYGAINRRALRIAEELKVTPLLWSVDPRDWAEPGAGVITSRVLKASSNGAVILLHSTHGQTVEALPGIISGLRERGFSFLTVSDWERTIGGGGLPAPRAPLAVDLASAPAAPVRLPADMPPLGPQSPLGGDSLPAGSLTESPALFAPSQLEAQAPVGPLAPQTPAPNEAGMASEEDFRPKMPPPLPAQASIAAAEGSAPAAEPGVEEGSGPRPSAARRAFESILPPARVRGVKAVPDVPPSGPRPAPKLRVFSNFASPDEAGAIWDGARAKWQVWSSMPPARVELAPPLPVLPEGEDLLVFPPAQEAPAAAEVPAVVKTTGRPAPMDLEVCDLLDPASPRTQWEPAQAIPASILAGRMESQADGGASAYFLSLAPALDGYTAVELATYLRLARLSGLLISTDMGCPPLDCELPYAYDAVAYNTLDRAAMLDLTVEGAPEALDALAGGKETLFVVVRPRNLHFFIAAHAYSEMSRGMADFVLLRQATAGLRYDTPPDFRAGWQLPPGVDIARFSAPGREAILLYKRGGSPAEVEVPSAYAHMSALRIEAGGYLRIAQREGVTVLASRTPAVLYYEAH